MKETFRKLGIKVRDHIEGFIEGDHPLITEAPKLATRRGRQHWARSSEETAIIVGSSPFQFLHLYRRLEIVISPLIREHLAQRAIENDRRQSYSPADRENDKKEIRNHTDSIVNPRIIDLFGNQESPVNELHLLVAGLVTAHGNSYTDQGLSDYIKSLNRQLSSAVRKNNLQVAGLHIISSK
ncbi:MAG: hypothetical protein Q7S45_00080 [Candidatus Curtissbacteria bacterium]|nr:hypothetical protein [Candidatus Curtissbacteria bacterium]